MGHRFCIPVWTDLFLGNIAFKSLGMSGVFSDST